MKSSNGPISEYICEGILRKKLYHWFSKNKQN
jgi:hypothetical protein